MNTKRIIHLLLLAALCSLPLQASAQGKIALVDLRKLFEGYYKTKQADAKIKERAAELDEERESMMNQLNQMEEDYNSLEESAKDFGVSREERDRRKAEAEKKLQDIRGLEQRIQTFDSQARSSLGEQSRRMRERVLEEINAVISEMARTNNYYLVLDVDALSKNETKIIVYHNGENEITSQVLAKLNAGAPAGLAPQGE